MSRLIEKPCTSGAVRSIALLALPVLIALGPVGSARAVSILLNDGLSHTVMDGLYASDSLYVRNVGCGTLKKPNEVCAAPGAATDLLLASGGSARSVYIDDSSSITLDGGTLGSYLVVRGASTATMTSGSMGSNLAIAGTASLAMSGGTVGSSVNVWDDAIVSMNDGSVGTDFSAQGASTSVISGGTVADEVVSGRMSAVTITGGTQLGGWRADGTSTITIVGSDFTVDGVAVPYGPLTATSGTLAGTLDSGESIAGATFSQAKAVQDTGRIVLAPSAVPPAASEDVLVNWGGSYLIDDWTYAHDVLFVRNFGCGTPALPEAPCAAPGTATVLELGVGAGVGAVQVHDSSTLALAGGLVGVVVEAWDSASVDMSDGQVAGLSAHDASAFTLIGGRIRGTLIADGNATVDLDGGFIDAFTKIAGRATVYISGGSLRTGLQTEESSTVTVSGGSVSEQIRAGEMSAVTLMGGVLPSSTALRSRGSATLTIVGSGFAVDGVAVGYGPLAAASGQLTGTLDAGDSINNAFWQGGSSLAPGRIVLAAAPDPLPPVGDVLLNDGGAHLASDWDSSRSTFYVRNAGCGSAEDPTAPCASPGTASDLEIAPDAAVGAVEVRDTASVRLNGGIVGTRIDAHDSASITIEGGFVGSDGDGIEIHDSASLVMNAGSVTGGVRASGSSSVTMAGGYLQWLTAFDSSLIEISSGEVSGLDVFASSAVRIKGDAVVTSSLYSYDTASVIISGGTMGDTVEIYDASTLTVEGGLCDDNVVAYDTASITVTGGTLNEDLGGYGDSTLTLRGVTQGSNFSLSVLDTATLTIHGSGFAVDGVPVGLGPLAATIGTLSGTLETGDVLDSHFFRDATASITLVPEPALALAQAVALFCVVSLARGRHAPEGVT